MRVLIIVMAFLAGATQALADNQVQEGAGARLSAAGGQGRAMPAGQDMLPGRSPEPLRLSLAAPLPGKGKASRHGAAAFAPVSGKPGGRRPVQESEHRPIPKRTYYLNTLRPQADVRACVLRPDGSVIEPELRLGGNPGLSFPTPMGDGPVHGANNVYVVEEGVENNVLTVRTAKWITMHHNCGWGHDRRFDETRVSPQSLNTIPFEIVIDELWGSNFHAKVTSGDRLRIKVLAYGNPVPGAEVTLRTAQGWSRTERTDKDGAVSMQIIRDYYPASWPEFKRAQRSEFLVTARYDTALNVNGVYQGKPYKRLSYVSTLPWTYSPARQDYSSYSYGLLIGTLTMTVSGAGVYAYRERRKKPYKGISFDE